MNPDFITTRIEFELTSEGTMRVTEQGAASEPTSRIRRKPATDPLFHSDRPSPLQDGFAAVSGSQAWAAAEPDVTLHPSAVGSAALWVDSQWGAPVLVMPQPQEVASDFRTGRPGFDRVSGDRPVDLPRDTYAGAKSVAPPATTAAAMWEVDSFEFPTTIARFIADPAVMRLVGQPLDLAIGMGVKSLLVTSDRPGAGRTSVATCFAVAAARAGLGVVLIDATIPGTASKSPTLTESLQLEISHGWLDAVRGGVSIAETAIRSIEDQLTLLPWVGPRTGGVWNANEFALLIDSLRSRFDLIVIDGPSSNGAGWDTVLAPMPTGRLSSLSANRGRSASGSLGIVDAAIVVRDARDGHPTRGPEVLEAVRQRGIITLGMVDNFV
jgi:Mrp family chromosome partitioning ATPase